MNGIAGAYSRLAFAPREAPAWAVPGSRPPAAWAGSFCFFAAQWQTGYSSVESVTGF